MVDRFSRTGRSWCMYYHRKSKKEKRERQEAKEKHRGRRQNPHTNKFQRDIWKEQQKGLKKKDISKDIHQMR